MTTPPSRGEAPTGATVIASLTNGDPWTRPLPHKLPEVSPAFWVRTLISTIAGATIADFLSADVGLGLGLGMSATTAIMCLVTAGALIWQLSLSRYVPGCYWIAVLLAAVLSTLVSDDLVDNLGVSPWAAAGVFCAPLFVAFTGWRRSQHAGAAHTVDTRRREAWFWFVVLSAFSLGASLGDLLSEKLALGYTTSSFVFAGVLAVIAFAHHGLRLSAVTALWAAYVVVRSLGTCLGDVLTATPRDGGLGLRTSATSAVLLAAIVVMVSLSTARAHRTLPDRSGAGQASSPTVSP